MPYLFKLKGEIDINNGYIELMMPEHPNARANGTILEHRYVASKMLGRPLKKFETVHHLDENRTNNSPENLIVFRTNADHSRFHKIGVMKLMNDGTYICPIAEKDIIQCEFCGKYFVKTSDKLRFCSVECYRNNCVQMFGNRNDRPTKEQLEKLITNKTFVEIGKEYGVSDNAVRKWCKKYGLPYKYRELHPIVEKSNTQERYIVNDNYTISATNEKENEIFFKDIFEAINYIKENYAINTSERNIRTKITDSAKHNTSYFGHYFKINKKSKVA